MTREQLDEIEKLAAEATPGPWQTVVDEFHADSGAHQVALHDCFTEQDADKNAAFIRAMREHALPLVKALREAWAAADIAKAFHDVAVKERDYERVVNNRMRAALDWIANPVAIGSAFHEEAVARARREL